MRRAQSREAAAVRRAMPPDRSGSRNSNCPMSGPMGCRASWRCNCSRLFAPSPKPGTFARKHLQRVVGDHVTKRFVDDRSGDYRYALEVEVVMVYRVYLTGSITDLRRTEDNKKGGLMALWPFGSSQSASAATVAAPAAAS